MVELNLKNIYKKYPNSEHYSVEDFNLEIQDKEFIVFVGPSGCGKSTTLRMIAGLEDITEGECSIDGRVVNDVAPKDRDIAMVFQNYALYPHMTVYDNMAFGLKLRKYSKDDIDKRVQEAAEILGLKEFLDRKPADLSGGQRQRVAMGLRVSMRAEIAKIHRRIGATTIYVTHDQTEAMTLADRIVIMSATKNPSGTGTIGRVEQVGTPQELYKHPVNKFVAGFIGSPAMNFINVKLEGNEIVTEGVRLKVPEGILKVLKEKGYEGKELIFGIRPEDINTEPAFLETFPDSVVHATISVSELLGSESHLYCQVGKNEFIAKVDARDYLQTGEGIDLGFDLNKAHFFDKETEKTVY